MESDKPSLIYRKPDSHPALNKSNCILSYQILFLVKGSDLVKKRIGKPDLLPKSLNSKIDVIRQGNVNILIQASVQHSLCIAYNLTGNLDML